MENINNVPTAYEGREAYLFVSYAHKDAARVLPLLWRMQRTGVRVWFDKGIEAGAEWPETVESRLINAECIVVFLSEAAVSSLNCGNEINLALLEKKKILGNPASSRYEIAVKLRAIDFSASRAGRGSAGAGAVRTAPSFPMQRGRRTEGVRGDRTGARRRRCGFRLEGENAAMWGSGMDHGISKKDEERKHFLACAQRRGRLRFAVERLCFGVVAF